jgi:hypothetical protein
MIHSNYRDSFYHRLVFLVTLTVLLKNFTPQPDIISIINALHSLSIIDSVLILSLLWTSFWHSVPNWLLTDILAGRNEIYDAQKWQEGYTKLQEWSQQPFVNKLLIFSTWNFLKEIAQSDYGRGSVLDDPRVRIPVKESVFCPLLNFHTASRAHTASWLVCFIGDKAAGTWA